MAQVLILLPALIALIMLYRQPASNVMLKVYLPCIMLVPMYLHFGVGAVYIEPISFVVMPLAILGFYKQAPRWKWAPLDICVLINAFSAFYADAHHRPVTTACYALAQTCFASLFPYFVGRTLIEPVWHATALPGQSSSACSS